MESPRRRLRLTLRGVLAILACVAVGFTVGIRAAKPIENDFVHVFAERYVDWFTVLLAIASALMAIGLLREAVDLHRKNGGNGDEPKHLRFATSVEGAWRIALAVLLCVSLALRFLVNRGKLQFQSLNSDHDGLWIDELWWLVMIVILRSQLTQAKPVRQPNGRFAGNALILVAASALLAGSLIYRSLVHYLVHLACAGVDIAHEHTVGRYKFTSPSEQRVLAYWGMVAMASWTLAACALVASLQSWQRGTRQKRALASGLACLGFAIGYSVWFNASVMPQASPDLAIAGRDSTWVHDIGVGCMVALVAACGALRYSRIPGGAQRLHEMAIERTWVCLPFLVAASAIYVYDTVRMFMEWSSSLADAWDVLGYMASDPKTYLQVVLLITAWPLAWRAFVNGRATSTFVVAEISKPRLAVAWLILTTLIVVGSTTAAAFSFSWWLGPW
jgi:hypothetical protein